MRALARLWAPALAVALGVGTLVAPAWAASGVYCHYHGVALNDLRVTPGARLPVATATVCRAGYSSSVRNVSEATKARVYAEYGITHRSTGQYEIDHLISLELGGSNAITNLWPEPNDHPRGYLNSKDILENRLHALVCQGHLSLASAQAQIASNWVLTFHRYLGAWPGGASVTTTTHPVPTTSPVTTTSAWQGYVGVRVTSLTNPVAPGGTVHLSALSTTPYDSCSISVALPSGRDSTASGLGPASANASGVVSWTWQVDPSTGAGEALVTIICGTKVAEATFIIS